jgi:hypothetical protein
MNSKLTLYRTGIFGAGINIAGVLLSGPIGLILLLLLHPSPPWQSPAAWAQNYHPIQTLPFFFGFLLLAGYLVMMAVTHQLAEEQEKIFTLIALLFTTVFASLIFFNYINQTTFLPALARAYLPEYDGVISAFSLDNPIALCWAIEMWGYALLGVATWLTAPVFKRTHTERITGKLMVANGIVSLLSAFAISTGNLSWVLTPYGLAGYSAWNLLVLVMAIYFLLSMKERMAEEVQVMQSAVV